MDLVKMLEDIYKKGYEEGRKNGYEQGIKDGYEEGWKGHKRALEGWVTPGSDVTIEFSIDEYGQTRFK